MTKFTILRFMCCNYCDSISIVMVKINRALQVYGCVNLNTIKSYKIVQKLPPKHAARGVAQSPYPIYRHGKACLSKQPLWRAAGDPRLARSRSRVRAPGPAGALCALFSPPSLPSSFGRVFSHLPHQTCGKVKLTLTL